MTLLPMSGRPQPRRYVRLRSQAREIPAEQACAYCMALFTPRSVRITPKACRNPECRAKDDAVRLAARDARLREKKEQGGFDDAKAERIWRERYSGQEQAYYKAESVPFQRRRGGIWI